MITSHPCGRDPGVFLQNASDVNRRYLHRMEQATEGIFYCTAQLHNPDLDPEDAVKYLRRHLQWIRIWDLASLALLREMKHQHCQHFLLTIGGLK